MKHLLRKALYLSKQAVRSLTYHLFETLKYLGLTGSNGDESLFIRKLNHGPFYFLSYVDDFLMSGPYMGVLQAIVK